MLKFIKENINGILGTLIFHLLIVAVIMAARLSAYEQQQEQTMLIEFADDITAEEFREFTEALMSNEGVLQDNESNQVPRNIAVSVSEERPVPDDFREMSSEQLSRLDQRVDEILSSAENGNILMPEQPEIKFEPIENVNRDEDNNDEPYTGPTTITYDLPGRSHVRIPVPVYRCPDGGVVDVNITVDRQGRVIDASVDGSPGNFSEICVFETALEAAKASRFNPGPDSSPLQEGVITFYFQKQ